MVVKSRVRYSYVPSSFNGVDKGLRMVKHHADAMQDSSISGSARTDVSSVDRFLADPTNRGDFARALQQDNRSPGDVGLANFRVDRYVEEWKPADGHVNWILSKPEVTGFTMLQPTDSEFPSVEPFVELTSAQLRSKGQTLHLRSLPNRDQADLGTCLMEIVANPVRAAAIPGQVSLKAISRQGRAEKVTRELYANAQNRHHITDGMHLDDARAAADDYLAYIFGTRPTVSSLDSLAESISLSRRIAEKVARTGYKHIRRRRSFPPLRRMEAEVKPNAWTRNYSNNRDVVLYGDRHAFHETTQEVWYSASYQMPVPDTESWLGRCNELFHTIDRITGLGLDVRVAWDLIPFSFLADWFTNTGDFLESRQIIADYNIVCEYGYIMCHTRVQKTMVAIGHFGSVPDIGGSFASTSWSKLTEVKQRSRAGNFGFNTDFEQLNEFQWSALVALGLTYAAGHIPVKRS